MVIASLGAFAIDVIGREPLNPGAGWHTYRLEAREHRLRLLIDGAVRLEANDRAFRDGPRVGLWASLSWVAVRRFAFVAL
jgi:hypothetical protein